MTFCKYIFALSFSLAVPFFVNGQVINDWSTGTSLPGGEDNGIVSTIGDSKNASTSQFLDWEHTLGDFADIKTVTQQELEARITKKKLAQKRRILIDGILKDIPSMVDENGIDLYMLTDEGISIYLKLLNPAFYQETNSDIIKWIRYYAYSKRDNTKKMFERYTKWEPYIKSCFDHHNVPKEISVLCLIESACTYTALSKAGALGMWQIMPATGRQYGMTVNEQIDQRKDPVISTETAAKILSDNYKNSGDWTMAIAGYNCGIGRVNDVSNRVQSKDWSKFYMKLPKETQQYIPSLIAIYYVWEYREKLGIDI